MNRGTHNQLEATLLASTQKQYASPQKRTSRAGVIYTRVSSQEQAENNSSLQTQLKLCQEYAKRQGITIKAVFGGTYESAKTDGRKEFQHMLTHVKKDKDVAFIIVYNYDRFSRTGPLAAKLSDDLRGMGITLKSVSQDVDNSTASGRLQENMFHVFNHFDNQTKSERTSTNTREVMLKGYWPYATPLGYQNLKPKHRACDHQYVITEEGKLLKKAFQLKAEGGMTNKAIVEKLSLQGLRLTEKNFRWILSNPFYAGYVTGKLVEGKLIRGHHPVLIDLKTFLKANQLLEQASGAGIAKQHKQGELPLKIFAREEESGSPFTGYIKKGNWYYKARAKGVGVNVSAKRLNAIFQQLLTQFEYNPALKAKLKMKLLEKAKEKLAEKLEETVALKKGLTETRNLLDKVEERFAIGEINRAIYEKVAGKYQGEIQMMEEEIGKSGFDSSNLEAVIDKALSVAVKLSTLWASTGFDNKQRLQALVFPAGISYNKKKGAVRTERVNTLFEQIPLLVGDTEENENDHPDGDGHLSSKVHRNGFEL